MSGEGDNVVGISPSVARIGTRQTGGKESSSRDALQLRSQIASTLGGYGEQEGRVKMAAFDQRYCHFRSAAEHGICRVRQCSIDDGTGIHSERLISAIHRIVPAASSSNKAKGSVLGIQ